VGSSIGWSKCRIAKTKKIKQNPEHINYNRMDKAIFYFRCIIGLSKCVDVVGISLWNRHTNMEWEKTRKHPHGDMQKLAVSG